MIIVITWSLIGVILTSFLLKRETIDYMIKNLEEKHLEFESISYNTKYKIVYMCVVIVSILLGPFIFPLVLEKKENNND